MAVSSVINDCETSYIVESSESPANDGQRQTLQFEVLKVAERKVASSGSLWHSTVVLFGNRWRSLNPVQGPVNHRTNDSLERTRNNGPGRKHWNRQNSSGNISIIADSNEAINATGPAITNIAPVKRSRDPTLDECQINEPIQALTA